MALQTMRKTLAYTGIWCGLNGFIPYSQGIHKLIMFPIKTKKTFIHFTIPRRNVLVRGHQYLEIAKWLISTEG